MNSEEVLVVVEVLTVHDADLADRYRTQARLQFGDFGGSLLARGNQVFEGDPPFGSMMIQRWPSEQAFRTWQASDAYRPLLALRRRALSMRISILPIATTLVRSSPSQ